MTEIKWIKLSVNMFNDEKIKLIRTMPEGDKIIVIWVQLLCLAGKTNDNGSIYMGQHIYYTDEMLATLCDQPLNIMRIAISTLEQFGMIEKTESGVIEITNWEKHQNIDGMEKIKEKNAERQQLYYYRKKIKQLDQNVSVDKLPDDVEELKNIHKNLTLGLTLANALEGEKELEEELELDKEKDKENKDKKEKKSSPTKHQYGEFKNVLLTDDEHEKLKERFPYDLAKRIERLSGYVASTGKKYKSHYATIINWAKKDKETAKGKGGNSGSEYDNLF